MTRLSAALLSLLLAASLHAQTAPRSPTPRSMPFRGTVTDYARGLVHPWGLAFLPDGRLLVTERPGRLRVVDKTGRLSAPLAGVPRVHAQGQGGLLDVALDPDFAKNDIIYLSYAESDDDGKAGTAVARARFTDAGLQDVKVIYRQQPKVQGSGHFGSRIVFRRDGTMFITQGDRMRYSEQAQDLGSGIGKVVRVNRDGTIPKDNPFVGRNGARPEIWSYGHRNAQAAALHPDTGDLWTVEHGARGGDELNRPQAGKNYGWPVITYGVDYSGIKIGAGITAKAGMEQPVYYWDPVIAPSGMVFYTGNAYPGWKGSAFVGSLQPGQLVRLSLQNGRVSREERFLGELDERIRDVEQGPDGLLYLITDSSSGRVLRLDPAPPTAAKRPVSTYSIVARDPATGQMGVAVQSHWFAVGQIVPWAEAGVGAVATQSFVDPSYGKLGLDLLRAGKTAPDALRALLGGDAACEVRQVGMVDAGGVVATFTGNRDIVAAGGIAANATGNAAEVTCGSAGGRLAVGRDFAVQANLMANDTVWPAMAKAFAVARGDLAERMLAALDAAQAAGGDIRGKQSAALVVVNAKSTGRSWQDRAFDVRVDDHARPLEELRRLVALQRAYNHMNAGDLAVEHKDHEAALREYSAAERIASSTTGVPQSRHAEMLYWHAVALVNMKRVDEALPIFARAYALEPSWRELTPRLVKSGLLPEDAKVIERIVGAR